MNNIYELFERCIQSEGTISSQCVYILDNNLPTKNYQFSTIFENTEDFFDDYMENYNLVKNKILIINDEDITFERRLISYIKSKFIKYSIKKVCEYFLFPHTHLSLYSFTYRINSPISHSK